MINESIYQSGQGGKLYVKSNDIQLTSSLSQEIFIAMFGGNREQSTTFQDTSDQLNDSWWGNTRQGDPEDLVNSETERVLMGSDLSFQSLARIEAAVKADTDKFKKYGTVEVQVNVPDVNRIEILVKVIEPEKENKFSLIWDSTRNEVIEQLTIK